MAEREAERPPARRGRGHPHEDPPPDGEAAEEPKGVPEPATPDEPYAYIADEALFIYDPESASLPARAYSPGDLVPPSDLERHPEWAALVHAPEE